MITFPITSPGFESCGTLFLMTVSVPIQGLKENASWQKKINGLAPARSCTGIWFACLSGLSVVWEEKDAPLCWHDVATCSLDQEDKCLSWMHYFRYYFANTFK